MQSSCESDALEMSAGPHMTDRADNSVIGSSNLNAALQGQNAEEEAWHPRPATLDLARSALGWLGTPWKWLGYTITHT